jgi:hypothetical protein
MTVIEEVFKAWTEQVNDEDVVKALLTKVIYIRNTGCRMSESVNESSNDGVKIGLQRRFLKKWRIRRVFSYYPTSSYRFKVKGLRFGRVTTYDILRESCMYGTHLVVEEHHFFGVPVVRVNRLDGGSDQR